ncbi:MAG: hypothetical protein IPK13_05445 [Deltaproteobacteria bacterium]|nr:hypothetical protein [Deltaproteobacteria bacterium]
MKALLAATNPHEQATTAARLARNPSVLPGTYRPIKNWVPPTVVPKRAPKAPAVSVSRAIAWSASCAVCRLRRWAIAWVIPLRARAAQPDTRLPVAAPERSDLPSEPRSMKHTPRAVAALRVEEEAEVDLDAPDVDVPEPLIRDSGSSRPRLGPDGARVHGLLDPFWPDQAPTTPILVLIG